MVVGLMAGVDTILRLIGGTIAIFVIIFISGVFVMLYEPIQDSLTLGDLPDGWGAPQDVVFLFGGLALVGLLMVIIIWWLVSPAREDVRQDVGGPPF